jgi:phosphohistidine phosphatase
MKCYFLRHGAAAEPGDFPGPDFDRPLTDEGRKRLEREARTMAELSLELDVMLTSPLVRAKQTAAIVAEGLKMRSAPIEDKRLGGSFDSNSLADILGEHADARAIMLVGHEPGMSQTIGHLIGGARIDLKKGGLACVNLPSAMSLAGELAWLIPPKVLALTRR